MKPDKKRHFVITAQPYKQDILVCINLTKHEAFKVYKRLNKNATKQDEEYVTGESNKDTDSGITGTMYPMSCGYLITLKSYKDSFRKNILNALHEITHAVHYILRHIRIPLEENTEEAYTYLLEDLYSQYLFKLYK